MTRLASAINSAINKVTRWYGIDPSPIHIIAKDKEATTVANVNKKIQSTQICIKGCAASLKKTPPSEA